MAEHTPIARSTFCSTLLLLQERGFGAGTVIDIGAAEGNFFLFCSQVRLFPDARHFFVDAMQENAEIYRRLADRFEVGHEITALSSMDGEVVLRVDPNFYNTHIDHLQPGSDYTSTRRVPMCTLDGLVARHELQPPYVLKLDVQGGELDVLRGALRTLDEAVIVTSEIQIFSERDNLVELLDFMQGNGWALYDLTDLAYYPSDSTFYQCYATFIPKSMDFRKGSPWILPGQEAVVYEQLRARRASRIAALEALAGKG
ncbi:MAG: FkbM family methyltransferase [Betaproteobacteria bacterium]